MRRSGRRLVLWQLALALWLCGASVTSVFATAELGPGLQRALAEATDAGATGGASEDRLLVWVFFAGKGPHGSEKAALPSDLVSARSLARRAKVRAPGVAGALVDARDLPVAAEDVAGAASRALKLRHVSKWFNAASVVVQRTQIEALRAWPRVRRIELVTRYRRAAAEPSERGGERQDAASERPSSGPPADRTPRSPETSSTLIDYGSSLGQLQQIGVPALHDLGLLGEGVLVGHFDNGYRLLAHEVFASVHIVAARDFVDGDADPAPPAGSPSNFGAHGVATLSVLAGDNPGTLVGVVPAASYVLARTEDDASETPVEEDHWIAAIEWADSLGIDVASTSLGYLDFDAPYASHTWEDMDGATALITQAADLAVGRGIVVVNSAGNQGLNMEHNTLLAPADGDSVIAAGSVRSTGERSSFSSVGPTTDAPARIKPDVMAQGSSVHVARATGVADYGYSSGTSFSCPLVAGVAALLVQAYPAATPMQIRTALRETASNAATPDNLYGWGIVNASAAHAFLGASDVPDQPGTEGVHPAARLVRLEPAVPNPFNPTTTLHFVLTEPGTVALEIFDARGRRVRSLVRGAYGEGRHAAEWDGRDDAGRRLASGVYACRLHVASAGAASVRAMGSKAARSDEQKVVLLQ